MRLILPPKSGTLQAVGVISVPYFIGAAMPGLVTPQPCLRLSPPLPDGSPQRRMAVLYGHLADHVAAGTMPVVYAGDCLAAIGVLAGLQRAGIDPTLVWFDAHGDFHTWETTRSGFLGGMPLAMIVGRGEQTVVDAVGLAPLDERRVVLVGARDLDPGEDEAVAASSMTVVPSAVDLLGRDLPPGALHVHIDLDVVDPRDMPAHNYPGPGGPSLRDMEAVLARVAATGRVAAVSFSTWNPALPGADRAAAAAAVLADAILGIGSRRLRWAEISRRRPCAPLAQLPGPRPASARGSPHERPAAAGPRARPAAHRDGALEPLVEQEVGGALAPAPRRADHRIRLVALELADAVGQPLDGDVDGPGQVAAPELGVLADVEDADGALRQERVELRDVDLGPAQALQEREHVCLR